MSAVRPTEPLEILRTVFGYPSFRSQQGDVIDHVVGGGDALVLMPTGGGKSLCYQVPAIARPGVAIVVSPLIALMQDQVNALRQLGVEAAFVNSSLSQADAADVERRMRTGELDLLYVAPERLVTPRFLAQLDQTPLALFAIDESHCVSQWGHDFRPEYRQLSVLHERFPNVPRIALTATADAPTRRDIVERLDLTSARQFISGFDRPNIRYRVVPKQNARRQLLRFLRDEHRDDAGIVYCMSRRRVEDTAEWLSDQGFRAIPYHAGLDTPVRNEHQRRFLHDEGLIVVATIAFGMGIDKPNVRFVAHLDLPKSMEAYYQETGRAGRDGLAADAWMTYGYQDVVTVQGFINRSEAPERQKRIEHQKLDALLGYCETTGCRRRVLLEYFGDAPGNGGCRNCDTCLEPVETWDGSVAAQKALSCAYRTEQRFGAAYLSDVLLGGESERIVRFGHDRISTYGIGSELTRKQWLSVYRQLVAAGLLRVDPEHGSLRLTGAAKEVLRGERPVRFRRDPDTPGRPERAGAADRPRVPEPLTDPDDKRLFDALRRRRRELAEAQAVPPYVIFHDNTLREMVRRRPATLAEMSRITGVGETKLNRYGRAFLEAIQSDPRP